MSTYKRRIVYLSDEEWNELGRRAKDRQLTISATIRALLVPIPREASPRTRQVLRDELLGKINRGKK